MHKRATHIRASQGANRCTPSTAGSDIYDHKADEPKPPRSISTAKILMITRVCPLLNRDRPSTNQRSRVSFPTPDLANGDAAPGARWSHYRRSATLTMVLKPQIQGTLHETENDAIVRTNLHGKE
jgi:hypothetical protein